MSKQRWLSLVGVSSLALASPLLAQPGGERADPHLRNDCRLAAQVIRTGNPAPRRGWAYGVIRRCDESGPSVLAEVWRAAPPTQPDRLAELFNATRDFNDRRVVDAVADVARERSAPDATRIYAMALLFNYAVPGLYIDIEDLLNPGDAPAGLGSVSHDTRAHATRAQLGDLRPQVGELLDSIIAREPDGNVGQAAATILRYLRALS